MKENKNKKDNNSQDKSSAIKDYLQGILFLGIPILIIYLIIKFA